MLSKEPILAQRLIKNKFGAAKSLLYLLICAFNITLNITFLLFANFSKQIKCTVSQHALVVKANNITKQPIHSLFTFNISFVLFSGVAYRQLFEAKENVRITL